MAIRRSLASFQKSILDQRSRRQNVRDSEKLKEGERVCGPDNYLPVSDQWVWGGGGGEEGTFYSKKLKETEGVELRTSPLYHCRKELHLLIKTKEMKTKLFTSEKQ